MTKEQWEKLEPGNLVRVNGFNNIFVVIEKLDDYNLKINDYFYERNKFFSEIIDYNLERTETILNTELLEFDIPEEILINAAKAEEPYSFLEGWAFAKKINFDLI